MGGGALEYGSDEFVPTWEQKQGAVGLGFRRKKGVNECGIQIGIFGVKLPKL